MMSLKQAGFYHILGKLVIILNIFNFLDYPKIIYYSTNIVLFTYLKLLNFICLTLGHH